ncbi:DUF3427 domain-containing protein [Myroides sp. LJL119]
MQNHFLDSLRTGYVDHLYPSVVKYRPEILINDFKKQKKVLSSVLSLLLECQEFTFSVAFLTKGGLAVLITTLDQLQDKGVKGTIIVSKYLNFTSPYALEILLRYKNIELRIDTKNDFHAKCYTFNIDNTFTFIIGSSNLTDKALTTNYEFNIKTNSLVDSELARQVIGEQKLIRENSILVTQEFIEKYKVEYEQIKKARANVDKYLISFEPNKITPNTMQKQALENLKKLRENGAKKALLISATGTGKTYLSAFDVKNFKAKKVLFIVHRSNIASKSMASFEKIIGYNIDSTTKIHYGLLDKDNKDFDKDYIFSTVQTINRDDTLNRFARDHFDYIIIDETHRAAAKSYQKILDYFTPKFFLGMTATPERTDEQDIYGLFDHNIAYEIRLNQALEADLLTTFHYYGISDFTIDGELIDEKSDFNKLVDKARVEHILEKVNHYSTDCGQYRALVFCSKVEEAESLAKIFNRKGYKSLALSGKNTEAQRENAILSLESDQPDRLEFIFTVDIFNEGIDIPKVNLIVMLRATQSAIIFVQQLGRGLRKAKDKSYVTIIDFIGNYQNNYLIPIALFGDTSYNKDHLRKTISQGSLLLPGASTVEFDLVSKQRIFDSINSTNLSKKKDLQHDYTLLKYKLGHTPSMVDFIEYGSRDPYLYVSEFGSYYNAVRYFEKTQTDHIDSDLQNILRYFDSEINNAKRILETYIIKQLLKNNQGISIQDLKDGFKATFEFDITNQDVESAVRNINFDFTTTKYNKKNVTLRNSDFLKQKSLYNVVVQENHMLNLSKEYKAILKYNPVFNEYISDSVKCALLIYTQKLIRENYQVEAGFILNEKYSRKDVYRILNESINPVGLNIGGYKINDSNTAFPIFVNYHKQEGISETTKYEDGFIDNSTFQWMSKSNRSLNSPEIITLQEHALNNIGIYLFIKKDNDEGADFYFMGSLKPIMDSFKQSYMPSTTGNKTKVVEVTFLLDYPVKESLYNYIINK